MVIKEFGEKGGDAVILLHGGGLSWWSCRNLASLMEDRFHIVVPILDGHPGSDRDFVSIEDNASEIISFIDGAFSGHVKMISGLSLGGQILLEILSQRGDICSVAAVESALAIPMKITNRLIAPSVNMSFPLIKKRWFAKLQFKSLHLPDELFEEYYRDTCLITRKNMIAFMASNTVYTAKKSLRDVKAKVLISAGGRETPKILRSAEELHAIIPHSSLKVFDGLYHGEASIKYPKTYLSAVRNFENVGL